MTQVSVTIGGRQYRMACEDGQEEHLLKLATDLDDRIARLRENFGEIGDARLTVMAALTFVDEMADAQVKLQRLEQELTSLQDARVAATDKTQATQAAIVAALNAAAERIETVTQKLNQTPSSEDIPQG